METVKRTDNTSSSELVQVPRQTLEEILSRLDRLDQDFATIEKALKGAKHS